MNASEAREISNKNKIKNSQIPKILEKISEDANQGLYACTVLGALTEDEACFLRGMEYKIVYYPNPYPGNPCESDYTTISW